MKKRDRLARPRAVAPVPGNESLSRRYREARETTVMLAAPLSAEDCAVQSMPDASPTKWHLGHTTWFFETFVLAREGFKPANEAFRVLFNSYYVSVGERHPRPERGLLTRPSLAEVLDYRCHVDAAIVAVLAGSPGPRTLELIELGIQHEQQHQELLLTDIKHLLSRNPLKPVYRKSWPLTPVHPSARGSIEVAAGAHWIGHSGAGFHFDNESPRHRVLLEDFRIARSPVTNGDFLEFMADGGYARPELWLFAGWEAVSAGGWRCPLYWECLDGEWHAFTLHGMAPVDPKTPLCHVSFYEADAFARWSGARLPSEAEWEAASAFASRDGNFLETKAFHPLAQREAPVDGRLEQAFGDVWEWTRSDYGPYPGFRPAAGAVGEYNGKFMCGQYVLRGGSCATPAAHARATYRNFFPPEARWQFSGIRLAWDARVSG